MGKDIQPIFILPEGSVRNTGKEAQRANIEAAKLVAETVRTTLGPMGMDKMIVDKFGDVIVTNDGVTILDEMAIDHPAGKLMVEIAKTQEQEIGDGTTTAVVIAGELLANAQKLIAMGIHPTLIVKGYRMAAERSQEFLDDISIDVKPNDKKLLQNIAMTAMTGKGSDDSKEHLAKIVVDAVLNIMDSPGNNSRDDNSIDISIDTENIKIEKVTGGSANDTKLINGVVLDKEVLSPSMPYVVEDCRIALVDSPIEVRSTENDAKIQINDPSQLSAFLDQEEKSLMDMVDKIYNAGANVVFCQKGIDDIAAHFLAKKGIMAVRRIKRSDMERLARATGGNIVKHLDDLSKEDLGYSGIVKQEMIGNEKFIFVERCKKPKAVTILVKSGTSHAVDEIARSLEDAIGDIVSVIKHRKAVAGAGACEVELMKKLERFLSKLEGKEQIIVDMFKESLSIIPKTLAENSGLDTIEMLAKLKSEHQKGNTYHGINVFTGKVFDSFKNGIIEPLDIKRQAIASATDVANLILRIDDIIVSPKNEQQQG